MIANVNQKAHLPILLIVLALCSVLATLPFAVVDGGLHAARVAGCTPPASRCCSPVRR